MRAHTLKSILLLISVVVTIQSLAQSKNELKKQIANLRGKNGQLEQQVNETQNEKETINKDRETLKGKLDRISNIKVDDVITPDEQPKDIVIGESGWRVELNGNKYKSDLIGQLGTIWILDTRSQLQPQGAIPLSDYKIEPSILSNNKDLLYKKFISKGTKLEGAGGAPFATVTAGMSNEQFSQFTINIEGTSLIKPKLSDLKKIASDASEVFKIPNSVGVLLCTGMHVIRYHSRIYSKSDGNAKITSPVVNIGGNFYGESNEESSEYMVVRQLTQLNKQTTTDTTKIIQQLTVVTSSTGKASDIQAASKRLSPEEVLTYFLNRQPTLDEIVEFQSNPTEYLTKIGKLEILNAKEKQLFDQSTKKLAKVPDAVKSIE